MLYETGPLDGGIVLKKRVAVKNGEPDSRPITYKQIFLWHGAGQRATYSQSGSSFRFRYIDDVGKVAQNGSSPNI